MATRVCPACRRGILKNTTAHEKSTKSKITKMAGCAEQLDVVDESDVFDIKRVSV